MWKNQHTWRKTLQLVNLLMMTNLSSKDNLTTNFESLDLNASMGAGIEARGTKVEALKEAKLDASKDEDSKAQEIETTISKNTNLDASKVDQLKASLQSSHGTSPSKEGSEEHSYPGQRELDTLKEELNFEKHGSKDISDSNLALKTSL